MARTSAPRRARPPRRIRLLVLDVDGVLTDGRLYYGATGQMLQAFHVRDGHGIKAVMAAGIRVAIVSGRRTRGVVRRARELGVRDIHQGVADKLACLRELCARYDIATTDCAAIGDDSPDAAVLRAVGWSFAVADAHADARQAADQVTTLQGGRGAVREVCDRLLAQAGMSVARR